MTHSVVKIALAACVAMVAFAFNSLLARAALGPGLIDPASYTTVRLVTGAVVLLVILAFSRNTKPEKAGSWTAAFWLFVYAVFLSYAYISLDTGVGALILFAAVQGTMIGWGIYTGERPSLLAWAGNLIAIIGFLYLVSPGLSAPDVTGSILMFFSGVAWGIYSLMGRGSGDPLAATARNFKIASPMTLAISLVALSQLEVTYQGVLLAAASGGITSALGYVIWYIALKGLTATQAAVLQLSAPVIAAFAGVLLLDEILSQRLVVGSILIIGGILTFILAKSKPVRPIHNS